MPGGLFRDTFDIQYVWKSLELPDMVRFSSFEYPVPGGLFSGAFNVLPSTRLHLMSCYILCYILCYMLHHILYGIYMALTKVSFHLHSTYSRVSEWVPIARSSNS